MSISLRHIFILMCAACVMGCHERKGTLFTLVNSGETNITFANYLTEDNRINILSYEYVYNGGGVAAGDFNNDGMQDLFFTGNQVGCALYLNEGNLQFKDVTDRAGVRGHQGWKTGVTTADVNGDGLLDIYVCYSGNGSNEARANQLFINNGGSTPTFTDRAGEFGLDAIGTYSTQASFFDFDLDGDLDMFLLNHAKITYSPFFNTKKLRSKRHQQFGNRLYKNENGKFYDVSEAAGIHGSGINFGLGISVGDVNDDGWPDIYVTNDYEEQDYFYLNKHDGTFEECLKSSFRHISRFGMGSDIADYNNDGRLDVFVVDMLPEDNYRQKLLKGPDEYDKYNLLRDSGFHHQNMRNMLQLNLGSSDHGNPMFSEIGQLAGVSNTDWSWCPLFVDLDNDGWKDLFITNGYLRDFTNMDFLKYAFENHRLRLTAGGKQADTMDIIKAIPASKLSNYCYHNKGDLTFTNVTNDWGLKEKAISNGAVFADLDNDGDQDIVINNLNERATVYRNNARAQSSNHFIKIRLKGDKQNTSAVGSRVYVKTKDGVQVQEHFPARGFQSSVAHELIFGLGNHTTVDEVVVRWPNQKITKIKNADIDTLIVVEQASAEDEVVANKKSLPLMFEQIMDSDLDFTHRENKFIDYKIQYLVPYLLSSNGPCLAKADVNNDGLDDLYVGGSVGQNSQLFLSHKKGGCMFSSKSNAWQNDTIREDTDALFLDVDNDGDEDLYVVRGGTEFLPDNDAPLQDRLYMNDGMGKFSHADKNALPEERSNGSFVAASDFDKDGDLDLFIGGKTLPGFYPLPAYSYLLRNDTKGKNVKFTNVTPEFLELPAITTSGLWMDYDHDGWEDLVVAGEFTPIRIFRNDKGILRNDTSGVAGSAGLWSKIVSSDIDDDGDIDLVAGNAGLNTQFKANPGEPLTLHYHDFNEDGKIDPIISFYIQGVSSVYPSRDEMLEQMPHLKRKFVKYEDYARANLRDILDEQQLKKARILKAETLCTTLFLNDGKGHLQKMELPVDAQFSKVNGIIADDFNNDGIKDILLSGNFFPYRVQLGRNDASTGLLLTGNGHGKFLSRHMSETGFNADGDVRSMISLNTNNGTMIVCGVNNSNLKLFKINKK